MESCHSAKNKNFPFSYTVFVQSCLTWEGTGGVYLQSESNDFKALLHSIKLLFVRGVAHNVGPQLDVLVAEVPAQPSQR